MKKLIAVLLSVLIVFSFAACDKDKKDTLTPDTAKINSNKSYTDFEGVDIKITNVIWNEQETKIEVDWTNDTDFEVLYGESYSVEFKDGDEWVSCQKIDELYFNSLGYVLKPHQSQQKVYNLTDTFDISNAGTYRLKTDCHVYNNGKAAKATKCNLFAEFTVSFDETKKDLKKTTVDFTSQYIRTGQCVIDIKYPIVEVISSLEELNAYYYNLKDTYNLEPRELRPNYIDETIGFLNACEKYDEEYFKNNILVMVILEEGSGSITHNVDSVETGTDGKLYVNVSSIIPEVGTCDMAQWHILIEAKADIGLKNESDIVLSLDGKKVETNPTVIFQKGRNSNFAISIPYDWAYRTVRNDDRAYAIEFWPKAEKNGRIILQYCELLVLPDISFDTETLKFGNYTATKYSNHYSWDHIIFDGLAGIYVVKHEGADKWLEQYNDEIMDILCSVQLSHGVISEALAEETALQNLPAGYEFIYAYFDTEQGYWFAKFKNKNDATKTKTLTISPNGSVINLESDFDVNF